MAVLVGVAVFVAVAVGGGVAVAVAVMVGVIVRVGATTVGVAVAIPVAVAVGGGVAVSVLVAVAVPVGVTVAVAVSIGVGSAVFVVVTRGGTICVAVALLLTVTVRGKRAASISMVGIGGVCVSAAPLEIRATTVWVAVVRARWVAVGRPVGVLDGEGVGGTVGMTAIVARPGGDAVETGVDCGVCVAVSVPESNTDDVTLSTSTGGGREPAVAVPVTVGATRPFPVRALPTVMEMAAGSVVTVGIWRVTEMAEIARTSSAGSKGASVPLPGFCTP